MDRWTLHFSVLGALLVTAGLAVVLGGVPALLYGVLIGFGFYAGGTSGFVTAFGLERRGVVGLHGALVAGVLAIVATQYAQRKPTVIEGRKLELKRWWLHSKPGAASGTVYAEVESSFNGTVKLGEFSATAAGQPVLQAEIKEPPLVLLQPGQVALLSADYSRTGQGDPDGFALSLKLFSGVTSRSESVDYSTDFASRKDARSVTNRALPPASQDPQGEALPFEHTEALKAFVTAQKVIPERCYKNVGQDSAPGDGSVSMRFSITPAGRAEAVRVEENTLTNERVAACLTSIISNNWKFPFKPVDYVVVRYRFLFEAGRVTIEDPLIGG